MRIATVCREGSDRVVTYGALLDALRRTMVELDSDVLLMVDGGELDPRLRGEHRKLRLADRRVLEDPWPEYSHNSQLLQIADLVVHAAFQHVTENPQKRFMWIGTHDRFERAAASSWRPAALAGSIATSKRLEPRDAPRLDQTSTDRFLA